MSALRSLLVHVDAGRHAGARLDAARLLAGAHGARLLAMLAIEPSLIGSLPIPTDEDAAHRRAAKARFDRAIESGGPPVEWLAPAEQPIAAFRQRALLADLLVLGQRDAADARAADVPGDFVEATVIRSGTPAIVLPARPDAPFRLPSTMLVAWKASRESARALKAAMALMRPGHATVHLATYGGDAALVRQQQHEAEALLRLHGAGRVQLHHAPEPDDPGRAMLALARTVGADLLAMGCYGHGRAQEFLLGGATFTVLNEMTLPVLLAH